MKHRPHSWIQSAEYCPTLLMLFVCCSYCQADSEFVLTSLTDRSAPGCSIAQLWIPNQLLCNDEQSRSGWGDHLNHQLQLAVCIDGNVTARYFPNRHSWLHSESAGDQWAEWASAYHSARFYWMFQFAKAFIPIAENNRNKLKQQTLPKWLFLRFFFIKRASSSVFTRN